VHLESLQIELAPRAALYANPVTFAAGRDRMTAHSLVAAAEKPRPKTYFFHVCFLKLPFNRDFTERRADRRSYRAVHVRFQNVKNRLPQSSKIFEV